MPKQAKTSPIWERFIAALRDLPHAKSDNQTVIGAAVGIRQTMVSSIKTGEKLGSLESAIGLATYAEMCVEFLITGKGPQRPWSKDAGRTGLVDADFQKMVQYWERLSDANRSKLLEQAELLFAVQAKHRQPRHLPQGRDLPVTSQTIGKKSPH